MNECSAENGVQNKFRDKRLFRGSSLREIHQGKNFFDFFSLKTLDFFVPEKFILYVFERFLFLKKIVNVYYFPKRKKYCFWNFCRDLF